MDIEWKKELTKNSYGILREAGYIPIQDRKSGKQSYVRKFTSAKYPRFHIYVENEKEDYLKLHLHLDHKAHGWGQRRHDTEYKGEKVSAETARLERWLVHFTDLGDNEESEKDSGGFFSRLFG